MEKQAVGMKRCTTIFTLLLWIFIAPLNAQAHPIAQYWQNRLSPSRGLVLEPRLTNFSTSDNFNSDSNKVPLPNQVSLSRLYIDINASYPLCEQSNLYGRFSVEQTQIKNPSAGDTTSLSFGDQLLGAAYRLSGTPGATQWSVQADVTLPAYSNGNQKQNGNPYVGDGSYDFTAGTFVDVPLSESEVAQWEAEAGVGYRYRTHAFSAALPWSLMFKRTPRTDGFLMSAGLRGQVSLDTDGSSPVAAAADQLLGAGGSDIIYAINPAWMAAHASLGFQTSAEQAFYVFGSFPFSGKNAPAGFALGAGVKFDFAPARASAYTRSNPVTESASNSKAAAGPTVTHRDEPKSFAYNLTARVTSINDQLYMAKIDQGTSDGVEKGQFFDIFKLAEDPGTHDRHEVRVARTQVTAVKKSEAAVTVVEYFVDQWIEIGFIAKRLVK